MEHFYKGEDQDGVRFTWNLWPSSSADSKKLVAPLACLYSPMKKADTIPMVNYDALPCTNCKTLLNPYCQVDVNTKLWACPFCLQRNRFPAHYDGITAANLPAELHPQATTIEYALQAGAGGLSPVFVFVVDICLAEDELESLKSSLIQVLVTLPEQAYVGLITYGASVHVYELGFPYFPKSHLFDGTKEYTPEEVQKTLGIGVAAPGGAVQPSIKNKFILPYSQVEQTLTPIIEELFVDPTHTKIENRRLRSTGVAVNVALSLLEYTFRGSGARVMVFGGGPATQGPGMVVGEELKESIRSHHELSKETAKHMHKASKYYSGLAERAAKNGHVVDIFSCSLDQTGILEMQELPKMTGGCIITSETFQHEQFRKSFKKLFELDEKKFLNMGFNVRFEVRTSRELTICGAIGHLTSCNNKTGHIAEQEVGIGRTCEWKTSVIDPSCAFAVFFEVLNPKETLIPADRHGMVQFKTTFTHPSGQRIMRVTTVAHNWLPNDATPQQLLVGFDQEACAAVVARLAIYKADTEEVDVIRWVDKHLIKFTRRYATYQPNNELTFQLPSEAGIYPQFMYHLRRSALVNVFGSSPDETVFYRYYLQKECTSNILIMIQPSLDEYALGNEEPLPVLLSSASLKPDVMLVLDTFFHVVVWSGDTIAKWRKAGYHEKPEHHNLKELMESPNEDVANLLNRFPMPLHVVCDQGTGPARYLLAVVDPSVQTVIGTNPGQTVNSEDASLQRFMDHLKKFSVQPE